MSWHSNAEIFQLLRETSRLWHPVPDFGISAAFMRRLLPGQLRNPPQSARNNSAFGCPKKALCRKLSGVLYGKQKYVVVTHPKTGFGLRCTRLPRR